MKGDGKNTKKESQPIGVFDSGVGGLSVLIELKKIMPHEDFVFLADQKNVPYGEKSKTKLVDLTSRITEYFIKKHDAKMIVVACNTATCGAIDELREKYDLPIIGTVPAIKPAASETKTGTVAIISTPSTSKSSALKKLISDHCRNIYVLNIPCKNLEDTVEHGELGSPQVNKLLNKYLSKIKGTQVDRLVLGCTHYPFLRQPIQKFLGPKVKLLDSGKAIAKQTKALILKHGIKNKQKNHGKDIYVSTSDPVKFSRVAGKLMGAAIRAEKVRI